MRLLLARLAPIAVALAVFCAVVALGLPAPQQHAKPPQSGVGPRPTATSEQPAPPFDGAVFDGAVFAYRSSDELVLVRGNTIIAHVPADSNKMSSRTRFTDDGRFAFTFSEWRDPAELTALDATNGSRRVMLNPERFSAPGPGSSVLGVRWRGGPSDRQVELIQLDLAVPHPTPAVFRVVRLPGGPHDEYERNTRFLSVKDARDGTAVIAVQGGVGNAMYEYFYLSRPDGSVQFVGGGSTNGNTTRADTDSSLSPDGRLFAYYSWGHLNASCGRGGHSVFDIAGGGSSALKDTGGPNRDKSAEAGFWWTLDSKVRTTYRPDCTQYNSAPPDSLGEPLAGIWEWDPETGRTTRVDPAGYTFDYPLPGGDAAVVNKDGLFVRHHGALFPITDESVSDIAVAPA